MICDDHPAIQLGVSAILTGSEIEVVGQAQSPRRPCNLRLRRARRGFAGHPAGQRRWPGCVAGNQAGEPEPARAYLFRVGGPQRHVPRTACAHDGYLVKTLPKDELLRSIRRAVAGKRVWTTSQIRKVKSRGGAEGGHPAEAQPLERPRAASAGKDHRRGTVERGDCGGPSNRR